MPKTRIKNAILKALGIAAVLVSVLACGTGSTQLSSSNTNCSTPLSSEDATTPLSRISLEVPPGWSEIETNQKYSTGPSILTVFVFETNADPKACIETLIRVVSAHSVVANYKINSSDFYIDNIPAVMAIADGYSDSSRKSPFRGIYASVSNGKWVYLFAWDAFGRDAVGTISDDAIYTIGTIKIR
jgi:hypothetical protein